MSEIQTENKNPLSIIFKSNKDGIIMDELSSINDIPLFFQYLSDEKISENEKIKTLDKFKEIISKNRYIVEYFSEYNNKSIYIFFFELFLSKSSSHQLKSAIISLFQELIINIETNKNIYEYLYQKLSALYRNPDATPESMIDLLTLLNTIMGSTENIEKPRNYFSCSGKGRFEVDLSKDNIKMEKYLTFIINFKISELSENNKTQENKEEISKLIKINLTSGSSFTIELHNRQNLKLRESDTHIKVYNPKEWINLILCIYKKESKLDFYFFSNGENNFKRNQLPTKIPENDTIDSIIFFDNFYGEVSSMSMALTKEGNIWSLSNNFLKWFAKYNEGLWKNKYIGEFFKMLKDLKPTIPNFIKNKSGYFKKQDINETPDVNAPQKNYKKNFIFIYTPFNTTKEIKGEVENSVGNVNLTYNGNIRSHRYQCFQKKLDVVNGISNLLPIAEMFLIRPKILNEVNLEIFLQIFINILKNRKLNIEAVKKYNFFQVLSLFIERYPKDLFTEKILENFVNLGRTIFSSLDEDLISSYFEYIFLNEKILSKYSENLQVKFWKQVFLFCESDRGQTSTFMNMNRICLILRFYDRNKYNEMCCEKHLSEIKDKFIGNKKIMNPTMETKLSNLREIFQLIISEQNNASGIISLYKLLTLDLSPCLTKFILNVLTYSLDDKISSDKLKISLKQELIENKYEVIAINTFIHALPDVRYDLLKLMFEINTKLRINFSNFQNRIKTCLLPQQMFYATYKESKAYLDEIEKKQMAEKKKKLEKEKKEKERLRMSSIATSKLISKKSFEEKLEDKKINEEINIKNKNDNILPIKEVEEKEIENNEKEEDFDFKDNLKIENNDELKTTKENEENKVKNQKSYISKSIAFKSQEPIVEDDDLYEEKEITEQTNENKNNENEDNEINEKKEEKEQKENVNQEEHEEKNDLNEQKEKEIQEKLEEKNNNENREQKENETQEKLEEKNNTEAKDENEIQVEQEEIKNDETIKEKEEKVENEIQEDQEEKNIIENIDENDEDLEKEIIIKDELYEEYKIKLFDKFILWSLGYDINEKLNIDSLSSVKIEYLDILEMIFVLDDEIKDLNLTLKFLILMKKLIALDANCYNILINKKIYANFLELTFKYLNSNDSSEQKICQLGREIIIAIFANSVRYIEKNKINDKYQSYEMRTLFLWGQEIIKNKRNFNNVFEFINSLLGVFLVQLEKYESKINFNISADIKSNYFLKNYLIYHTQVFGYAFHFQDFYNNFEDINLNKKLMEKYTSSMQIDLSKNNINDVWLNFSLFNKLYKRLNFIWQKQNIFKKFKLTSQKGNKLIKYENILNKFILDKNNKNAFLKELIFLTYEEKNNDGNLIISLLRIITISLMNIISILWKKGNDEEFKYWLKEFKKLIIFLIISSSNLIRTNQLELYNNIQAKIIGPLLVSICFLKDLLSINSKYSKKIKSSLHSILLFCFIITKYEHQYIIKHTSGIKKFNLSSKPNRNDLKMSAVYLIFNELLKDQSGNILLPLSIFENLNVNQYVKIVEFLDKKEWDEALFQNQNIKNKLLNEFFTFKNYKNMNINNLFGDLISKGQKDIKITEEILYLLPFYEKALSKYSNNSLENAIQKKDRYKAIKKRSFSWTGLWSDKKLFFENPDKLKYKIINHYTKTLMKPLLSPILDIEYYLPEFTYFKLEKLFMKDDNEEKNEFKLTMDIDKILKLSEQNQITMNNIKEIFDKSSKKSRENYLRKIYTKSNPKLAESLKKISNNLDLGKEDEFTKIEHNIFDKNSIDIKKPKYVLACLVKTSHHIKGVYFMDENNLNFKVFLNQRTGNSMAGVELAFTDQDDDYDINRHTCFGSYFICHPKDKDLYQISINYKDIKWIFRRRYYYKNSGLEIFTRTNKSFYFNFKFEDDREYAIKEIVNKIPDISYIYDDLKDSKDIFDNIIGYENTTSLKKDKKNKIKLSKKIEQWKNWKISNFEFLMWLNIYGNRSYNDLSQYPVFPWILGKYEDPLQTKVFVSKKPKKVRKNNTEANIIVTEGNSESDDDELDEWEITEGETEIDYIYRDLSLPMGMLEITKEGAKRKELFMEMYETLKSDPDSESKPFLFGSNYSNPTYVCNFMMRLFPFSHIAIELQGNKFDDPDRLFLSVKNSFFNSLSQKTDVRELIPEFFYLPEIFRNINKLNLGKREDGTIVDNIITPCEDNPFNFVMTMKTALENEKVSKTLQKWVDLIFGYKARGKEAELANNLFTEISYQENIDINNSENKESILRQVEFGLIPTQILSKSCSKRSKKKSLIKGKEIFDSNAFFSYNKCRKNSENLNLKHLKDKKDKKDKKNKKEKNKEKEELPPEELNKDTYVLCLGCFSPEKLSILLNNNIFQERKISCPVFDKVYTDELLNQVSLEEQYNKMSEFYSKDSINHKVMTFAKDGKIIILGGFFDGKVVLVGLDGKGDNQIVPFKDESPVLCIIADKDNEYIFMGNALGNVCIYKNIEGKYKNEFLLTDQQNAISHMFYSPELNLLATASIDGYICIYTLPLCKLIRCLKVPNNSCKYVILSDAPLPVIIVICEGKDENDEIYVYSINGNLFLQKEEYFKISNPILVKNINSNDYLACIGDDNIYILSVPDLIIQVAVEKEFEAHSMCFSEDNKLLYLLNKQGTEVMVIKTEKEKNKLSRSVTVLKK